MPIFKYQFKFPDNTKETITYTLKLDDKTFLFVDDENRQEPPSWAKLASNKCSNCQLDEKSTPFCPVARNLYSVVKHFNDVSSFQESIVFVETKDRSYGKKCTIQEGLFSIFGIIMATSGCIHMEFFRSMVRSHLPFATYQETFVRISSTHLMVQYLKKKKNKSTEELSLDGLVDIYREVQIVNQGILKRIQSIAKKDADKNALIILDNYASIIGSDLKSNDFETLNDYFGI